MLFTRRTYRNTRGQIVIQDLLSSPKQRKKYERDLPSITQAQLQGWERGHSQGAGTGSESPAGIRYIPKEVNQKLQNHGIESYLRQIFENKEAHMDFWLTTVTTTYPGTLRLAQIDYQVDAVSDGRSKTVLECSIRIADQRENPAVEVELSLPT
jgi:hypothetical protein